jgi:hypothetical protein
LLNRLADPDTRLTALNLPAEQQSHGLRKLTAIESACGSFDDAAAAITPAPPGSGWASGRLKSWHGVPPPTWTRSTPGEGPAGPPTSMCWC